MRKKIIKILIPVALVIMGITATYFIFLQKKEVESIKIPKQELSRCLDDNEGVSYKIKEKESPLADIVVSINDKSTKKELFSFKIVNIFKNYHPIELHTCGISVIRFFNYNPQKTKQEPGFKVAIWKYQYNGEEVELLLLSEKNENGLTAGDYSYDFRIDPNEKYIVLGKSYFGKDDYSLVIKDIKTKQDVFVLLANEISKSNPNLIGNFNMREWTRDGRYFWGDIFEGAYVNGFFRIDIQNWKFDIFKAPDGAMGGMPLNINTGYVPIQPGLVWTGDYQLTQELKEQYRKEGKKSLMYLYNLFSKEKIFIVSSNEPLWYFKPQWLSDTELQYELSTGEKKIYEIKPN